MVYTHTNNINISINAHLIQAEFRFIKVLPKNKNPKEKDFLTSNNYSGDDPRLLSWLQDEKGNYGVLCSKHKIAIDLDHPELIKYAEPLLKRTLKTISTTLLESKIQSEHVRNAGNPWWSGYLRKQSGLSAAPDTQSVRTRIHYLNKVV